MPSLQEVKQIIKSLVISFSGPEGLSVHQLNLDYRQQEGQFIPHRSLGFNSLNDFLNYISDTVKLHGCGLNAFVSSVSNSKTDHITRMVQQQKRPNTAKKRRQTRSRSHVTRQDPYNNYTNRLSTSFVRSQSSFQVQYQQQHQQQINYNYRSPQQQKPAYEENTMYLKNSKFGPPMTDSSDDDELSEALSQCSIHSTQPVEPDLTSDVVNKLAAPSSCLSKISAEQNEVTTTIDIKKSVEQYVDPLSVKSESIINQNTEYLEHYLHDLQIANPKKNDGQNDNNEIRMENDLNKISNVDLLSKELNMENGWSNKTKVAVPIVTDVAKKMVSFKANPIEIENATRNNASVEDFNMSLDDSITMDREAIPAFALDATVFAIDMPPHCMKPGDKLQSPIISDGIDLTNINIISISEIYNPYKFWFHFVTEMNELDILMEELEVYFHNNVMQSMAIGFIKPGQICAALFNKCWHRAEILQCPRDDMVKVFYVDYGTVGDVDINFIKYLPNIFGILPMQALRGCLSHVKPFRQHWSTTASEYFYSLVDQEQIHASFSDIDRTHSIYYMVLCSINSDQIVQINKSLVERNFAIYDNEWEDRTIERRGERLQHPREISPTFMDLESGKYPTLAEVALLLENNIDFEHIVNTRLFHPGNMRAHLRKSGHQLPFTLLANNPFVQDLCWNIGSVADDDSS